MVDYSLGPFDPRTETLLTELKDTLELKLTHATPEVLWHYTGAEGLRAIMSHHTLRLSHARFLNDPTEVEYGWRQATRALEEAMAAAGNLSQFFQMTHSVAGDVYTAPDY